MTAAHALNIVKQLEALADAHENAQMHELVREGKLVSSLQFFFDHPDCRVRLMSARTLLKLARGYRDDFIQNDLQKAKAALNRCNVAEEGDSPDSSDDNAELARMLAETIAIAEGSATASSNSQAASSSTAKQDTCGELVLKVSDELLDKREKILQKVVNVSGVVSVCFEGANMIVTGHSKEIENGLCEDLLSMLSSQGYEGVSKAKRSSVSEIQAASDSLGSTEPIPENHDDQPAFFDDDAPDDATAEPGYLDDDERDGDRSAFASGGGYGGASPLATPLHATGNPSWSFFSQANWMTGRRVKEFDDDPTIAKRLAKAKQRQEEKRKEEQSRLGALSRWVWGKR
jgi:hypothetical protein